MFLLKIGPKGIVLLVVLIVAIPSISWTQIARIMVEKPKYEVLAKGRGYQIRRYPSCVVAQVEIAGEAKEAMNRGFRPLANYIFGENVGDSKIAMTSPVTRESAPSQKIAMTTPVIQQAEGDAHVVSFIMPSQYSLDELPRPKDSAVRLKAVPERVMAVWRFTWRGTDKHMQAKEKKLRAALDRDHIEIVGPPVYARYDPPWTLPIFRRNEVMLPVAYQTTTPDK